MLQPRLLFLFIPVIFFACSSKDPVSKKKPDQIVLIIDKCPDYSVIRNENGGVGSYKEDGTEIFYRDDDLIQHTYSTASDPTRDTLVWPARSNLIEIEHRYKFYENISFLFYKGDTVLFTYDDDFPKATVLNRPLDSLSANYIKLRRERLLKEANMFEGFALYEKIQLSAILAGVKKRLEKEAWQRYKSQATQVALEELEMHNNQELMLLDSLLSTGALPLDFYTYYRQKMEIQFAFEKNQYVNEIPDALGEEPGQTRVYKWELPDSVKAKLIRFGYYNKILTDLESRTYHMNVPLLPFTARRVPDYRYVYDSIRQSSLFSNDDKKVLLTNCIKKVIEYFPKDDITIYFRKYIEDVKSDALIAHVASKYQHLIPEEALMEVNGMEISQISDSSYHLSLISTSGENVDFEAVLQKYKGKLVYVDVWSSTCLPCLLDLPHSQRLEMEYEHKDIQFVYISMDKEEKKWKKAGEKLGLDARESSYMINPLGVNKMLDELNIKSIPRFLLFDQEGKLVQYRAFGPKSQNIRDTFDKYLSRNL